MASELKVDKFTGVTTAGSISVTGEGNSTTTNLQQGLAKAWLLASNSASVTDSLNISGGTDNGTGNYTFAYSNSMGNGNYSPTAITANDVSNFVLNTARATGSVQNKVSNDAGNLADDVTTAHILGDLA
jgi:hypothetical protein